MKQKISEVIPGITVLQGGEDVNQSKNIGVGREFVETDNLKWIKRTDAFLVCDISEFPIVNLKLVDSVEIIGIAGFKLSSRGLS